MTKWPTPPFRAAARRLSIEVWKKAGEASSKVGEFVRLTTTSAPATASSSPRPLMTSTPVDFECGTASCPAAVRFLTTCDPISPVPPMTAIFMACLSWELRAEYDIWMLTWVWHETGRGGAASQTVDERDHLVERSPADTGITCGDVLEPDRH